MSGMMFTRGEEDRPVTPQNPPEETRQLVYGRMVIIQSETPPSEESPSHTASESPSQEPPAEDRGPMPEMPAGYQHHNVSARERQLWERENRLRRAAQRIEQRENEVRRAEQEQQRRKDALNRRELELRAREDELRRGLDALRSRQAELTEQEQLLTDQEDTLKVWQIALDERKTELEFRELSAAQRERELEGGADRLQLKLRTEQELQELKNGLFQVKGMFEQLARGTMSLSEAIKGAETEESVRALCELCRTMEQTRGTKMQAAAFSLSRILESGFGLQRICPEAGAPFDSVCHERLVAGGSGAVIDRCRAAGWRNADTVYIRAVVDTMEGGFGNGCYR